MAQGATLLHSPSLSFSARTMILTSPPSESRPRHPRHLSPSALIASRGRSLLQLEMQVEDLMARASAARRDADLAMEAYLGRLRARRLPEALSSVAPAPSEVVKGTSPTHSSLIGLPGSPVKGSNVSHLILFMFFLLICYSRLWTTPLTRKPTG